MNKENADFQGWATKFNLKCADGRTIRDSAFKDQDGATVPLVWNHQHDSPSNVLGHALLEYRPGQGMWTYGFFNGTDLALDAKEQVNHRDIRHLSIWANKLKQTGGDVMHGVIREVSLVMAGANPGAAIVSVMAHGEYSDEEAAVYNDGEIYISGDELSHSEEGAWEEKKEEPKMAEETKGKTVGDVVDSMTDEQRNVMYALIGQAIEDAKGSNKEDDTVSHNIFENEEEQGGGVLSHSDMEAIFADAKRTGSLKDAVLAHGIEGIETLFPEPKSLNNPPEWIRRPDGWVAGVMGAVHKSPFSRIKSRYANLTEDEARAKGYIKGKYKKEQVFSLLKRTTTPQTIYKKQKLDRDDVVDITDFDVVAWIRQEMRFMYEEEVARAILVGDGRLASDDDKISEDHIRPVWTDDDLFTIKQRLTVPATATETEKSKAYIRAAIKARKNYKGSGNAVFYTTEDVLTDMLLLEDNNGRIIYDSESKLATAMRVSRIVTVPVMEELKHTVDGKEFELVGLIVNLNDYNLGADRGGELNMFDDFDIDYNQMKYLIEGRCSGALVHPFSAIAIEATYTTDTKVKNITYSLSTVQDGLKAYPKDGVVGGNVPNPSPAE